MTLRKVSPLTGLYLQRHHSASICKAIQGSVRINLPDVNAGFSCSAMSNPISFRYFKTSPEITQLAVMLYVRFPLSLRNVEDLLHERGIDISHESVRFWWNTLSSPLNSPIDFLYFLIRFLGRVVSCLMRDEV